jgi:hypothetical protein
MTIALLHKHYSEEHLAEVMEQMKELGAPTVRAIWSDLYGLWLAVEGCHRIRAAVELGEKVEIVDVSGEESIEIQEDGEMVSCKVEELLEELNDNAPYTEIIDF